MEFKKVIKTIKRVCNKNSTSYSESCDKCQFKYVGFCSSLADKNPLDIKRGEEIIEEWERDNPVKTYQDVLKEKLENFDLGILDHYNFLRPASVFGVEHHSKEWDDEYKEEEQDDK